MPDTLIMVKGVLTNGGVVVKTFVTRHTTADELKICIDGFLKDTNEAGGIMFVKDQRQPRSPNNSMFYFKEAFHHLEFETKTITGPYDQEGTVQ
jgi:hypothetical protein